MTSTFVYLTVCSIRNRIRTRLRRLKQPRYLIGSVVGILYLSSIVFRRGMTRAGGSAGPLTMLGRFRGPIGFFATLSLFAGAAAAWLSPAAGRPIEFTPAEVQFLFQAPISRRQLLHYKLLRGQGGALFGSAVATVLLRPGSFATAWTFWVGMWLALQVMRLHFMGVALRRQSLTQHGVSGIRRQWLPLAMVTGAVAVLAATVALDWPTLLAMSRLDDVFREVMRLASTGAASLVLWPFRAVVTLPMSGTSGAFLRALPGPLLLLWLNYLWVLRSDSAFEEASAAYAEQRAALRGAPARGRAKVSAGSTPFMLSTTGRPETAILWKNLIMLGRYASLKVLLRVLPIFIVLVMVFSGDGRGGGIQAGIAMMSLIVAAFTVLMGPQLMRNDLRQDLASLSVLKTWPVGGAALIRGEVLAPAAVLTVIVWLLVVTGAIFSGGATALARDVPSVADRASYAAAAMSLAPPLILTQLVLHNGIAVMFPAWVAIGTARPRGIDAMGQRMLMLAGIVLTLGASLLPAALVAGAAGLVLYLVTRSIPVVVPAAIMAVVLIAECLVAIDGLGRVFERTDASAVDSS
ncbi:MAG TPA: putative ABC exporter domain-containing protein [Vicinamibacterales bacterium]|jgi:hypothetical protein|nr:putative ABC exporter domain-containing protein [Vicinamibacterales bacterium]